MNVRRGFAALATALALTLVPAPLEAQDRSVNLHVISVGSAEPVVVVLHGGPGMRHNYLRPEWDRLADVATIVYYDQRGCGLSTQKGPYTWQQHVQDLDVLLNELSPEGRIFLAGSSWGAMLAVLYADTHPERVAGLILSGVPSWTELVGARRARYAAEPRWRQLGLEGFVGVATYPPERLAEMEMDSATVANPPGAPPDADLTIPRRLGRFCRLPSQVTLMSLFNAPALAELDSLNLPILVVDGAQPDPRGSGAADLVAAVPSAELAIIEEAGHDPWLDQPESFFAVARGFLLSQF